MQNWPLSFSVSLFPQTGELALSKGNIQHEQLPCKKQDTSPGHAPSEAAVCKTKEM